MRTISSRYVGALRCLDVMGLIALTGGGVRVIALDPAIPLPVKCVAIAGWAALCYILSRIIRNLAKVKMGENMLLVTKGDDSIPVPLQSIKSVRQLPGSTALGAIISIDLSEQTPLGGSINFVPDGGRSREFSSCCLGREHPLVGELQARISQARRS